MFEVKKYSRCFICGDLNDHGLKARFYYDGEKATTEVIADRLFEGYSGIYHGGIISALLDEVMIKAILAREIFVMTVELTVRFHRPVKVGERITFNGWVVRDHGRLYLTEGEALAADGTPFATASGKYVEAKSDMKDALERSVD